MTPCALNFNLNFNLNLKTVLTLVVFKTFWLLLARAFERCLLDRRGKVLRR